MDNKMISASRKRSAQMLTHTREVIAQLHQEGERINFYTVSRAAGVSRQFLYSHEELRRLIDDCRITGLTKSELQKEVIGLRMRIQEMERK